MKNEGTGPRFGSQRRQPGAFQGRIIIRIKIIEADDRAAPRQQHLAKMRADKAGGAGNKNLARHKIHAPSLRNLPIRHTHQYSRGATHASSSRAERTKAPIEPIATL